MEPSGNEEKNWIKAFILNKDQEQYLQPLSTNENIATGAEIARLETKDPRAPFREIPRYAHSGVDCAKNC